MAGRNTPQIVTGLELRTGEVADFLGVHPRPPLPAQSALGRDEALLKAGLLLRDADRPGVIASDLNATPWESAVGDMQRLARLVDPRAGYGYLPPTMPIPGGWPGRWITSFTNPASPPRGWRAARGSVPITTPISRASVASSPADPQRIEHARTVIQRARRQAKCRGAGNDAG